MTKKAIALYSQLRAVDYHLLVVKALVYILFLSITEVFIFGMAQNIFHGEATTVREARVMVPMLLQFFVFFGLLVVHKVLSSFSAQELKELINFLALNNLCSKGSNPNKEQEQ